MRLMEDKMKNRIQVVIRDKKTDKTISFTLYDTTLKEVFRKISAALHLKYFYAKRR